MPRRTDTKRLDMQLTPEEYQAVEDEARKQGLKLTTFVRKLFGEHVPGFIPSIKDHKRKQ
jgi:hypothetical protein